MQPWSTWIEIPALDINRAKAFYEALFGIEIQLLDMGEFKMGLFPQAEVGVGLCQHKAYRPSDTHGTLVYLNGNPDLNTVLGRVEGAGGTIQQHKTQISEEYGYMAIFIDTEGNRIALHSNA